MKKAVIISCFNWYEKRIKPIREILLNRQYEVIVLIADFEHINKKTVQPQYDECTYIHVPEYRSNISISRIKSHLSFAKQCRRIIDEQRPDLVYCQVPPNKVANYCADYKKSNPDTTFIIDIIDLWPESMPLGKLRNTLPASMWKSWRDDAIKIADHVFTECDLYQEKLKDVIITSKTSTLYLYKEQSDEEKKLVKEVISKGKTDDVIRFAYLGSMNNILDIDGIRRVIQYFIDSGITCELHAIGDGESRDRFEKTIKNTGCKTMFYGPIFDELEKIRILTPCDYAFNMMKDDIAVGLTTKSIDYFSYGLPLINNIKGDTWELVEREGVGYNLGDLLPELRTFEHKRVEDLFAREFSLDIFIGKVEKQLMT